MTVHKRTYPVGVSRLQQSGTFPILVFAFSALCAEKRKQMMMKHLRVIVLRDGVCPAGTIETNIDYTSTSAQFIAACK
jgi:hypothetical protein